MDHTQSHVGRTTLGLFATLLLALAGCASEDTPASLAPAGDAIPERYQPLAREIERELVELEIPGVAVAVLEHGELTFAHGFGTKGIASDEPVDAGTLFRIGSMSKLLTAVGVMSAVDDGALALDAPVRDAIPDLSLAGPESDALTLRQVLSQQSGLSDYLEISASAEDSALAELAAGPELADNVRFLNPPGAFWNYSNPNFYLAGRALEAATGVPYREAVRTRVFEPLGMTRSSFLPSEALADGDYSDGYGVVDIEAPTAVYANLPPDAYDNAWARPAGYAFSNVLDWTKLMRWLLAGDPGVISAPARDEVISPQISAQAIYADLASTGLGLGDDYGFGVGLGDGFFMDRRNEPDSYYAAPFIGHGGDIPGFASTFVVIPSTGFGIVLLSNRDAARPLASLRLALETYADLPAPSAPPPGRAVDPTRFPSYAGTFQDADGLTVKLSPDGDSLRVSGTLLDAIGFPYEPQLEASSLDNFALWLDYQGTRLPVEVTLIRDESGEYNWFRSRLAVGKRVASPALAP